jgi:5-methylcytosine-specific restriction endonuclease McrA
MAARKDVNVRRARKQSAAIGRVDYNAILQRDGWVCHICGDFIEPGDLVFDHIIPLAKGGAHSNENLSPAHRSCNAKKWSHIVPSVAPPRTRKRH